LRKLRPHVGRRKEVSVGEGGVERDGFGCGPPEPGRINLVLGA
jgi:hypothetical protein